MSAHLAGVANIAFPVAGLIGALIIYSLRRSGPEFVRENARSALNMQITTAICNAVLVGIALVLFLTLFGTTIAASGACAHPGSAGGCAHVPVPAAIPWEIAAYVGCFALLLAFNFVVVVASCFGARAAYLGRVFRYPFAAPFVRRPFLGKNRS